jgi:hypothetical protein
VIDITVQRVRNYFLVFLFLIFDKKCFEGKSSAQMTFIFYDTSQFFHSKYFLRTLIKYDLSYPKSMGSHLKLAFLVNPLLLSAVILVAAIKVLQALQSQGNMLEGHLTALFHPTT